MTYEISKTFKFEVAHRIHDQVLSNCSINDCKCRSLHGHSAKLEVVIGANELNGQQMVIDFGDLSFINEFIQKYIDHKMLIYEGDEKLLKFLFGECKFKEIRSGSLFLKIAETVIEPSGRDLSNEIIGGITATRYPTTSERLSRMFFKEIELMMETYFKNDRIKLLKVSYSETDSSKATYSEI